MERLKNYLLENEETLQDVVREINSWSGSLDWLEYYENDDDFFECYFKDKAEVARAVYYGDYRYNDDYVKFNAYGNLESCCKYEYIEELKDYVDDVVEILLQEYKNLCLTDDKIDELIEEIKESEVGE